jgi:hypothetical protein
MLFRNCSLMLIFLMEVLIEKVNATLRSFCSQTQT